MILRAFAIYAIYAIAGSLLGVVCFVRGSAWEIDSKRLLKESEEALSVQAMLGNPAKCFMTRAQSIYSANVSAYCPCEKCCGSFADGITASGHVIQPGDKFVAAPTRYPFGTMLDIPGYGVVPVLDRGGAIKGNKLDVYFDAHEAALEWGRKRLWVRAMTTT